MICQLDEETGTAMISAGGLPRTRPLRRARGWTGWPPRSNAPVTQGRLRHIAADLFLGMLDGRWHGHTEEQIIADLLSRRRPEDRFLPKPEQPAAVAAPASPDPVSRGFCTDACDRRPASRHTASADEPSAGEPAADALPVEKPAAPTATAVPEPASGEPAPEPASDEPPAVPESAPRAGLEIRVGLATLLGRDQRPGEIPGLGPVTADVARTAVAAQRRGAEWRFGIVDDDGYLLLAGVTRCRPRIPGSDPAPGRVQGGIVELHVPAALLDELAFDRPACGEWAGVVADLAGQSARRDQLQAPLDAKPGARFARGALARHVQVRDRNCCHPGCQSPAAAAELDHTHDHAAGGPTTRANIEPGCERHHWYKTALGWRLRQPEPGVFEWTSPLRRVYRTRGEPIRPELPEPVPADHGIDGGLVRGRDAEPGFDPEDWQPDLAILHRARERHEPPPARPPPPHPTTSRRSSECRVREVARVVSWPAPGRPGRRRPRRCSGRRRGCRRRRRHPTVR